MSGSKSLRKSWLMPDEKEKGNTEIEQEEREICPDCGKGRWDQSEDCPRRTETDRKAIAKAAPFNQFQEFGFLGERAWYLVGKFRSGPTYAMLLQFEPEEIKYVAHLGPDRIWVPVMELRTGTRVMLKELVYFGSKGPT